MVTMGNMSVTHWTDRKHVSTPSHAPEACQCGAGLSIALGDRTAAHAHVVQDGERWLLFLVRCHRELEVSFSKLHDALRVAEQMVETAVVVEEMSYRNDPLLMEASA